MVAGSGAVVTAISTFWASISARPCRTWSVTAARAVLWIERCAVPRISVARCALIAVGKSGYPAAAAASVR